MGWGTGGAVQGHLGPRGLDLGVTAAFQGIQEVPSVLPPFLPCHYVLGASITILLAHGGGLFFIHIQVKDLFSS